MASGAMNRSLVARAAAVLTTGEVAATRIDLNEAWASKVSVQADFTKGSLTDVVLRFYVSMDGSTWYQLCANVAAAAVMTATLSANATVCLQMPSLSGWKFFRASAQGSGTVTSSSLTLTYRYLRRGSQG